MPLRTGLPGLRKRDTRFVADMVWPISTLLMADMVFCVADMAVADVVIVVCGRYRRFPLLCLCVKWCLYVTDSAQYRSIIDV